VQLVADVRDGVMTDKTQSEHNGFRVHSNQGARLQGMLRLTAVP
jgi:hypothetical protein